MKYIIGGIHTGTGKTICSAILCQALGYDYWKPVQAGEPDNSDSWFIRQNVSNPSCKVHKETYRFQTAASPHHAAGLEDVTIRKESFEVPYSGNGLIIESAGGLMSPLAEGFLNIDLMAHLGFPVILVSGIYLGSINHTLLSCEALSSRKIPVEGIVFSGAETKSTEEFILRNTGIRQLCRIPLLKELNRESIRQTAENIKYDLHALAR